MEVSLVNDGQPLGEDIPKKYGVEGKGNTGRSLLGTILFITITWLWLREISFGRSVRNEIDPYLDNMNTSIISTDEYLIHKAVSLGGEYKYLIRRAASLGNVEFKEKLPVPRIVIRSVISTILTGLLGQTLAVASIVILNFSRKLFFIASKTSIILISLTGIYYVYDGIINWGKIRNDYMYSFDDPYFRRIFTGQGDLFVCITLLQCSSIENIKQFSELFVRPFSRNDVFRFRYLIAFAVPILTMIIGILVTGMIVAGNLNGDIYVVRVTCLSLYLANFLYSYGRAVFYRGYIKSSSSNAASAVTTIESIFMVTRYHMGTVAVEALFLFLPIWKIYSIYVTPQNKRKSFSESWKWIITPYYVVFTLMAFYAINLADSMAIMSHLPYMRVAHPDNSAIVRIISTYWITIVTLAFAVFLVFAMLAYMTIDIWILRSVDDDSVKNMSEQKFSQDKSTTNLSTLHSQEDSLDLKLKNEELV